MNLDDIINLIICGCVLLFVIGGGIWGWYMDKKDWNGGYCRKCSNPWIPFDVDSSGAIGYNCACGKSIWVSYY